MKQFFYRTCSFLLFLQFSFSIQAQNELLKIDSLNQLISNQSGSERMKSLLALSEAYRMVSIDKSIKTGWDALTYADEHGLKSLKANVLRSLGQSAQQAGDFDLAADYYHKAAMHFSNLSNRKGLALTYNLIGILNLNKAEYDTALVYFERFHALAVELDNDTLICTAMKNKGQIWFELGELNKAHDSFYKASLVFLQLQDTVNYASSLLNLSQVLWQWDQNNEAIEALEKVIVIFEKYKKLNDLSMAYSNLGLIFYYDKKDYDQAFNYFQKSLKIRELDGNPIPVAHTLVNMANVFSAREQYVKARENYLRALQIYTSTDFVQGIVRTFFHLGESYHNSKEYTLSNTYLQQCLAKATEFGFLSYQSISNELLMKNYIALNDFPSFLVYYNTFKDKHDTLLNDHSRLQAQLAVAQQEYENIFARSNSLSAENEKLKSKLYAYNLIWAALLGFGFFAVALLLLRKVFRRKSLPQKENVSV